MTKIPRFTFEKFPQADNTLTTQMKSVGEVMAIGRTFQESLQKALRGLEIGIDGLTPIILPDQKDARSRLRQEIRNPTEDRLRYVADAMRHGFEIEEIYELTGIDPWFLVQLQDLVLSEQSLEGQVARKSRKRRAVSFEAKRLF